MSLKRFNPLQDSDPEPPPKPKRVKKERERTIVVRPILDTIISPPDWSKIQPPDDGAMPMEQWAVKGRKVKLGETGRQHYAFIPLDNSPNPKYEPAQFTVFTESQTEPMSVQVLAEKLTTDRSFVLPEVKKPVTEIKPKAVIPEWRLRLFKLARV